MAASGSLAYQQIKQVLLSWRPRYAQELDVPDEPEATFLLGNKWADIGLALGWAVVLPFVRGLLRGAIYEPLGRSILFKGVAKLTGKQADKLKKWNESCWKFTIFLTFVVLALVVSVGEPWFLDTRYFWAGCSRFPPCNLSTTPGVLLFYTVETGFYIQAIHFLAFHEVRRKDWLESMIHHWATVGLLLYSYYVNFTRAGVMILLIHDAADIFLEAAKLSRYARNQSLAVGLFAVFTTVWIVTRNVIFPFVLIRSTLTETLHYAALHNINPEPHYTIFNALLLLLEVLHIYWTYLILRIVVRQLTQGDARDIREGEGDSDDDD